MKKKEESLEFICTNPRVPKKSFSEFSRPGLQRGQTIPPKLVSCYCCILINQTWLTRFNERTKHFFIKRYISHFIVWKAPQFVVLWEIDWETYTRREDFFPYLLPGPVGANACNPLQAETHLIGCVFLARLRFSALCLNLTAWFSSGGLLPVTHLLYPSA